MSKSLINFIQDLYGTKNFIPLHEPFFDEKDKERLKPRTCSCITETVSMKQIPMNRKQNVPQKPQHQPEDSIDLEEVLREMGYGEDDDLRAHPTDEMEEEDEVGSMSRDELKQMIEDDKLIVEDILAEQGIKGIKYNDGITRNKKGTKKNNYVIFDARIIEISKKYGITIPAAGKLLMEMDSKMKDDTKLQMEKLTG